MTNRRSSDTESGWRSLRSLIVPNPLLGLILLAIASLIFAIFVFGDHGMYSNVEVADLLRTIGIGALAAAVTTIVDRHLSGQDLENRIGQSFREAAGVATALTNLGVYTAHIPFDFGLVFREAKKGETVSWLDTYCPRQNELIHDLKAALERGVHVRMLIIDPASANAAFRNQELQSTVDSGGGWVAGLAAFIAKMKAISDQDNGAGRFEIRFYKDLPCIPMYLVGKAPSARKGYISVFLVRATAHCQHLELHRGDWLDDMAKYFEAKWTRQPSTLPTSVVSES